MKVLDALTNGTDELLNPYGDKAMNDLYWNRHTAFCCPGDDKSCPALKDDHAECMVTFQRMKDLRFVERRFCQLILSDRDVSGEPMCFE